MRTLLATALGSEFRVISESNTTKCKQLAAHSDVVLVDLDSDTFAAAEQSELCQLLTASGMAVVVMADDTARSAALDLVRRGAHSSCRTPPVVPELRILLQRAYEHTALKRQLTPKSDPKPDPSPATSDTPWCDSL